jgi:hypothetical protein
MNLIEILENIRLANEYDYLDEKGRAYMHCDKCIGCGRSIRFISDYWNAEKAREKNTVRHCSGCIIEINKEAAEMRL